MDEPLCAHCPKKGWVPGTSLEALDCLILAKISAEYSIIDIPRNVQFCHWTNRLCDYEKTESFLG